MANKELKNNTQHKTKAGPGRPKGSPNKSTEFIFDLCKKHDFDPVEMLILIAKNDWKALGYESKTKESIGYQGAKTIEDVIGIKERSDASKTLVSYMYPKRKSVEFKDELSNSIKPIVLAYSEESLKKAASDDEAKD